jgi:hypothetical protein
VSRSSDLTELCVTMQGGFGSCNLNKLVSGRYYPAICSTQTVAEELRRCRANVLLTAFGSVDPEYGQKTLPTVLCTPTKAVSKTLAPAPP